MRTKYSLILLSVVTVLSLVSEHFFPAAGAPVVAMLIGAAIASLPSQMQNVYNLPGMAKKMLLLSVVLLGFKMNFSCIVQVGSQALGFMLITVIFSLTFSCFLSRRLKLNREAGLLTGIGTSICGGAAIAAAASVIDADEKNIAQSLSTIFLFNILAALLFPVIGHLLNLTQEEFGLWSGTAINDTSSVLAAAFSYGKIAGKQGMIVKLTRTLMIIPVTLVLGIQFSRKKGHRGWRKIIPWPVVGFLGAAMVHFLAGAGLDKVWAFTSQAGKVTMILALAGIGLQTNLQVILVRGKRSLIQGGLAWIALSVFSLLMMKLILPLSPV